MAKEKIRIDKINAPYNFVPLNEMVVIPEWGGEISQDLPFSDGEDGCIDVIVSNLSPIITCDDKSEKNNEGKYVRCPAHIEKDEEKHYYLPGSGLKGMLRNVLEIMTFGKMQQYNDDFFGYRDFTGKDSVTKDYPKKCWMRTFIADGYDWKYPRMAPNGVLYRSVAIGKLKAVNFNTILAIKIGMNLKNLMRLRKEISLKLNVEMSMAYSR